MSSRKRKPRSKSASASRKRISKSKNEIQSRNRRRAAKKVSRKIPARRAVAAPARSRKIPLKRGGRKTSRPSARYLQRPAAWFLKRPDGTTRDARAIAGEAAYYREGLKRAKALYAGFEAKDGYDIRRLPFWPEDRKEAALRAINETNRLYSMGYGSFITVKPRTPEEREALRTYTGQFYEIPGHPQERFLVLANVSKPKDGRVRYIRERLPMGFGITQERLKAEVVRKVKGGRLMTREYLFREILGFQPGIESATPAGLAQAERLGTADPWEQMKIAMRQFERLLPQRVKRGKFKGEIVHYQMLTDRGPVGSPMEADMLLANMERWGEEYGTHAGFAANLIGVIYRGSAFTADRKFIRQESDRQRYARERRERYKEAQKQRAHAVGFYDQFGRLFKGYKKSRPDKSSRITGRRGRVK